MSILVSSCPEPPPGCCRVTHGPEDKDNEHFLCCLQLGCGCWTCPCARLSHPEMFLFVSLSSSWLG